MNPDNENEADNAEYDLEMNFDADSDSDVSDNEDVSEDEFLDDLQSEMIELITRSMEHLKYLQKSSKCLNSELLDIKRILYLRFFKEIEIANDTIEQVEDELHPMPD